MLDESPTTNRDAGTRPAQGAPSVPGRVRQVAVPSTARALTTLSSVEYADAFVLETAAAQERTPEQWARVILEGAPSVPQRLVLGLLSAIGLQLAPIPSEGFIVGWKIQRSTPEFVLLAASSSRIGLSGELLFQPQQQTLIWTTFVQLDRPLARAVWAALSPVHRQVVRYLLGQTSR